MKTTNAPFHWCSLDSKVVKDYTMTKQSHWKVDQDITVTHLLKYMPAEVIWFTSWTIHTKIQKLQLQVTQIGFDWESA